MKFFFRLLLLFVFIATASVQAQESKKAWIFTYFTDNGQHGLHLAWSRDALNWTPLREGKPFFKPPENISKLVRDPSIVRDSEGTFHMVWTGSWTARAIGYARSKDLIEWTDVKSIPVMEHESTTRNTWAPELFLDGDGTYYIIWSSTIPGRFKETAGSSETDYNHRMYYTTTRDFKTFSDTKLYWNPNHNVIDGFLAKDGDRYLMFYKDETLKPEAKKDISLGIGSKPAGPFEKQGVISHMNWVEGPAALKVGDHWIVYYDCYTKKHYGAVRSKDLKTWENITDKVSFPKGMRHGTAFEVDEATLQKLLGDPWPIGVIARFDDHGTGIPFDVAVKMGAPTMQLKVPTQKNRTPENAALILKTLKENNVELSCVLSGFAGESYASIPIVKETVGLVPKATRAERVKEFEEVSDFAAALNCKVVQFHLGFVPHDTASPDYRDIVKVTQDACDYIKKHGQRLQLETGQETGEALLQFIKDVDRPNLAVNFDPANMILYGCGEPIEALKLVGKYVRSTHVKDAKWAENPGKEWGREVLFGTGDVGAEKFLQTLKDVGFEGTLTIERENRESPEHQRNDVLKTIELLKELKKKML